MTDGARTAAARRTAAWRDRERLGLVQYRINLDADTVRHLIESGLIDVADATDGEALAHALGVLFDGKFGL